MAEPMTLSALASRLRSAADAFVALEAAIEAGRPWPLSADFGTAPESYWGPPEVLAHCAEMLPYWTGELERILDEPDGAAAVPFGRVATDTLRAGVLERDRTLPPRELVGRIRSGAERLARRLETLPAAAGERRGLHQTLGELTVTQIAERFAAAHLEEHGAQLGGALDA